MDISLALPNTIPGTSGATVLDWARAAEERGFHGIAATERLVFPSYDPLTVLAAAAGATRRVRLLTNVLVGPLRSPVELAKAGAGLDQLSGGRFTLGLAPGVRADDFVAAGREFDGRVRRFDEDLGEVHRLWAAAAVTPRPVAGSRVPVLVGGIGPGTPARVARWADGWTAPGLAPRRTAEFAARVHAAWDDAGRAGRPRVVMLLRFALGADVAERASGFVRDYFAVLGADAAEDLVRATPRTASAIRAALREFDDCGVDEVVLHPTVSDPDQVDRLADVLL